MSFKTLLLAPDIDPSWPDKIREAVPGVIVKAFADPREALDDITDAEYRQALAYLHAKYGGVPPSLQRVIDMGGRFGLAQRGGAAR